MRDSLWVLMNPDNSRWDADFAREELEPLAKELGVKIIETFQTRDVGFGREEKFILEGEEENILSLEEELNEVLY
jgi:hypothetical protein